MKKTRSRKSRFRSGLEEAFNKQLREWTYEPFKVPYKIHANYLPDFVHEGANILVECKGFFRPGDTQKYKAVRDSIEEPWEVVFVLSDPNKKVRKGGKMTMGQWCEKEGFHWFTIGSLDELEEHAETKEGIC